MLLQQKIKMLLKKFEMTHVEIANFIGVSERAVYRWEIGKKAHRVFEKKVDELVNMKKVVIDG